MKKTLKQIKMKKIKINLLLIKRLVFKSLILALPIFVISSCSTDETQKVATFTQIVMQDEFDTDGAPNSTIWGYDLGTGNSLTGAGWGNNELQYYTKRTENVKVENGYLLITAEIVR